MGYTHYWYRPEKIEAETFKKIVNDFKAILPEFKDLICYEYDQPESGALIRNDEIRFNGKGDEGHETFLFESIRKLQSYESKKEGGLIFDFCKTARKPYDIAVCCALIIIKHHLKHGIKVNSDGNRDNWQPAIKLCKEKLGYGMRGI